MHRDDILKRMRRLDEHASLELYSAGRFQIVIVGGGALVVRGYLARATDDIDVLGADSRLCALMELYDMNGDVNAYMDHFAYNYEDRLVPLLSGSIDEDEIKRSILSDRTYMDFQANYEILEKRFRT